METWRDIPDYEGHYQASNLGRIRSIKYPKKQILNQRTNGKYLQVSLTINNKPKLFLVHRLVWISFNGKTNLDVDHIEEGCHTDNRLENLQILSRRDNVSKYRLQDKKTSLYTGVCWSTDRGKWMASIRIDNKKKYLGFFTDEIEAHNAYQKEYLNLNNTMLKSQ